MQNELLYDFDFNFEYHDENQNYEKNLSKDSKDIKKSIDIVQEYHGTYVVAVAVHKFDFSKNQLLEIETDFGEPITQEVYNRVRNVYQISGMDTYELGHIPVNYVIKSDDECWAVEVPLPLSVIKRYLTSEQKRKFNKWANVYAETCEIKFLQSSGVN